MAAATLPRNFSMQPRSSTETDRRHLLAESVAPSESASLITDFGEGDGDRTPRPRSPAQSVRTVSTEPQASQQRRGTIADPTPEPRPYRGFPSEAHYLAALNEWAEGKKYVEPLDTALIGFYGHNTLQELASKPTQDFGIKRKWRARKEAKQQKQGQKEEAKAAAQGRRYTVT